MAPLLHYLPFLLLSTFPAFILTAPVADPQSTSALTQWATALKTEDADIHIQRPDAKAYSLTGYLGYSNPGTSRAQPSLDGARVDYIYYTDPHLMPMKPQYFQLEAWYTGDEPWDVMVHLDPRFPWTHEQLFDISFLDDQRLTPQAAFELALREAPEEILFTRVTAKNPSAAPLPSYYFEGKKKGQEQQEPTIGCWVSIEQQRATCDNIPAGTSEPVGAISNSTVASPVKAVDALPSANAAFS